MIELFCILYFWGLNIFFDKACNQLITGCELTVHTISMHYTNQFRLNLNCYRLCVWYFSHHIPSHRLVYILLYCSSGNLWRYQSHNQKQYIRGQGIQCPKNKKANRQTMEIGLPNTMQKNKVGVARTQTRVFGNGKQWNYLFVSCQRSGYKSRNGKGEIGKWIWQTSMLVPLKLCATTSQCAWVKAGFVVASFKASDWINTR